MEQRLTPVVEIDLGWNTLPGDKERETGPLLESLIALADAAGAAEREMALQLRARLSVVLEPLGNRGCGPPETINIKA